MSFAKITTVKTLAQQVIEAYNRGAQSRDSTLDIREVMRVVRDSASYVMKGEWYAGKKLGMSHIGSHFVAKLPAKVQKDEQGNCYADIPCAYIALPNDMGVLRVKPKTGKENVDVEMIPIPNGTWDIYRGLAAGSLEGQWGYEIERDRVRFTRKRKKTLLEENIKDVTMYLVTMEPSSVADDDPFPMSPDTRQMILERAMQHFGIQESRPQDVINDNTPQP